MNIEQALPSEAATVAAVLNAAAQWLAADGRPLWSASDVDLERVQRDTDAGRYFIARKNGDVAGVVRLDCVADRTALRSLYEGFGFSLHSEIRKGTSSFARYELRLGN
jgi:hypothetical protein